MTSLRLVSEDYKYKHGFWVVFIFLLVKYMRKRVWQLCSWEPMKEISTGFSNRSNSEEKRKY